MEDAYVEAGGSPVEPVSDIGLRLRVLAGELYRAQCEMDWVRKQSFPETADGAQLDLHGAQRGVIRREAQRATGTLTFTRYIPISFDLLVPKGTLCASSGDEAIEYETTVDAILKAGDLSVTAPAQAVEPGAKGNAAESYINTLVTPVNGIQYASNRSAFTGGCDAEDEESYRARVVQAYLRPLVVGNAAYYEQVARSVPGITSAQAVADAETAGGVTVYLWGQGAAPNADTLALAAEKLEAKKAVGAVLTVKAAKAQSINALVRVVLPEGIAIDDVQAKGVAAVKDYLLTKQVGDAVPGADLLRVGLQAIPEALRLEVPASMQNYPAVVGSIPIAGTIVVGPLA